MQAKVLFCAHFRRLALWWCEIMRMSGWATLLPLLLLKWGVWGHRDGSGWSLCHMTESQSTLNELQHFRILCLEWHFSGFFKFFILWTVDDDKRNFFWTIYPQSLGDAYPTPLQHALFLPKHNTNLMWDFAGSDITAQKKLLPAQTAQFLFSPPCAASHCCVTQFQMKMDNMRCILSTHSEPLSEGGLHRWIQNTCWWTERSLDFQCDAVRWGLYRCSNCCSLNCGSARFFN